MNINNTVEPRKALIMAGGTGGHIFPALAVANTLKARGFHVEWLGAKGKMEERIVPENGIRLHTVAMSALRGKGIKGLLLTPFKLLHAVYQARRIIRTFSPEVVIGFGGFASAPGGVAARLMGVCLIVHEQNAIAGMTNKLLAKMSRTVLLGFSGALPNGVTVGNPVRADILALPQKKQRHDDLQVLVVGGSLGAQALNQYLPAVIAELSNAMAVRVHHQTGKNQHADVQARYAELGVADERVEVSEFISDMAKAYQWADVVVCRSGALTVAEVAIVGVPALFVPFPHAVDDHQTHNARYLVEAGGAQLVPEQDLKASVNDTVQVLTTMAAPETWVQMCAAQYAVGEQWRNATQQVADFCEKQI